jgi:hypothetical protein
MVSAALSVSAADRGVASTPRGFRRVEGWGDRADDMVLRGRKFVPRFARMSAHFCRRLLLAGASFCIALFVVWLLPPGEAVPTLRRARQS